MSNNGKAPREKTDQQIINEMLEKGGDFYHQYNDRKLGRIEVGMIGDVQYTLRTPTRTDFSIIRTMFNQLVGALPKDSPAWKTDIDEYCSLAVCGTIDGLRTVAGELVTFTNVKSTPADHMSAFELWMNCAAPITTAICKRLEILTDPPVPDHFKPLDELTTDKINDPNLESSGTNS